MAATSDADRTGPDEPGIVRDTTADRAWLERCLELAGEAAAAEEVPVGAVVIGADGALLGEGRNRCLERVDPTAHAEMLALRAAFVATGAARLPGATLYCSLEPCFMCTGALLHARVARVVFSTWDPKFGACGSLAMLPADPRLNHRCPVHGGELAERSATMLRDFFRRRR